MSLLSLPLLWLPSLWLPLLRGSLLALGVLLSTLLVPLGLLCLSRLPGLSVPRPLLGRLSGLALSLWLAVLWPVPLLTLPLPSLLVLAPSLAFLLAPVLALVLVLLAPSGPSLLAPTVAALLVGMAASFLPAVFPVALAPLVLSLTPVALAGLVRRQELSSPRVAWLVLCLLALLLPELLGVAVVLCSLVGAASVSVVLVRVVGTHENQPAVGCAGTARLRSSSIKFG